ncbi:MAG: hypothetical protein KatS3mg101_0949 [Patescibacteria group bacterium]|nr:MAG: hypothetical protein KatS3mg101_0949 [Patescibacteria group bacterium]
MADEPTPKDIELVDQIPPFGEEPQKTVEETPQEKPQETEEKIKEEIKEEPC